MEARLTTNLDNAGINLRQNIKVEEEKGFRSFYIIFGIFFKL